MDIKQTSEIETRRAILVKVQENGNLCKDRVAGFEWGEPTPGSPYILYIGKGNFLRTSPIREVKEIHNALMFRTVNSLYRIEYPE